MATSLMVDTESVQARARTHFDRHWREWAQELFEGNGCTPELSVNLKAPREKDLSTREATAKARDWVSAWRTCSYPGTIDWQTRHWSRVGNQKVPTRILICGARNIARWAGREAEWDIATLRIDDLSAKFDNSWNTYSRQSCGKAVKASIETWQQLDNVDWTRTLEVLDWLLSHQGEHCYARQLPVRGIDSKWVEKHNKALRPLFYALAGADLPFSKPAKLFRCKACCASTMLCGCTEFSLNADDLSVLTVAPSILVICENLVNTLCMDGLEGVLAIHGSGFAVSELARVTWLNSIPIVYWGDLDSNGFAILDMLRGFAPHTRSAMMDVPTLMRYYDLCVEEPVAASGTFKNLTDFEHEALSALQAGDPLRNIESLRLEQERIEWDWAMAQIRKACVENSILP